MMRDPDIALETHAREELGIDPGSLGSPVGAAVSSFMAFCVGGVIPLIPWFFARGNVAVALSILLGAIASLVVGALLAQFTGRSPLRSALRQLLIAAVAAGVTFAIGNAVGVTAL
jgi:VIT1/CCC1 family predicted Fe2+/Mn2+ transporter